jgi:hypothetical protein
VSDAPAPNSSTRVQSARTAMTYGRNALKKQGFSPLRRGKGWAFEGGLKRFSGRLRKPARSP